MLEVSLEYFKQFGRSHNETMTMDKYEKLICNLNDKEKHVLLG